MAKRCINYCNFCKEDKETNNYTMTGTDIVINVEMCVICMKKLKDFIYNSLFKG